MKVTSIKNKSNARVDFVISEEDMITLVNIAPMWIMAKRVNFLFMEAGS
jgi:hypothetical protein